LVKNDLSAREDLMPRVARRPLIIAHRGASAHAPENTLAAFQLGIDSGADGVELDVRLSKDGVPVVVHDRDLRRLAGRKECVSDLTAKELAAMNVGTTFKGRRRTSEFAGVGIPTLASVLELFSGSQGIVHIELKIDKKRELKPLVSELCAAIHDSPELPRIVISSFRLTAIAEAKHILPSVRTSALFAPSIMKFIKRRRHMISLARAFGANEVSPYRALVTPKLAHLAGEVGMPVNIWTCDTVKWIDRSRDLGLKAVMTNDPAKLLSYRFSLDADEDFSR
jgi:glycerophosphoryl diester phosphodiesterase